MSTQTIELMKKVIEDKNLIAETERVAVLIADSFIEKGIDIDGGVMNDFEPKTNVLDGDKHWWPQAEALVGLHYAYTISNDEKYLKIAIKILNFIQTKIIDHTNGEWFWRVDKNGKLYTTDYKIGMWKAPYHNSRACIVLNS